MPVAVAVLAAQQQLDTVTINILEVQVSSIVGQAAVLP
jgi:hypothetical protein